jgi:hypothetical protein
MQFKYSCSLTVFLYLFTTSASSQRLSISADDKHISYEGRILFRNDAAELSWPGMSITVSFLGSSISGIFKDQDTSNYYNVIIDKKTITKIHLDTAKRSYILADGLPYGKHTIKIFKRTEWDKGKTWFYGFESDRALLFAPPNRPRRKMEIFGNSITCGYGIEDYAGDSPIGYYQNSYNAYGALTARHFNAQCHYTAKSGIGIMISWFPMIMPEMYDRTDPTDSTSKWDFSKYTPDLVIINLLQNDYWLTAKPEHDEFRHRFGTTPPTEEFIIASYRDFVKTVRTKYPKAKIICMLGSMNVTQKGSAYPGYVEKAVAQLQDKKIFTWFAPYKNTPGHPKTAEQKVLADGLIKFIDQHIKW